MWDATIGTLEKTLQDHEAYSSVKSVAFNHDGSKIVSGSGDMTVRVWDAVTGTLANTLNGHTSYVMSVAFNHDGSKIVSGSGDHTVRVWDASAGTLDNTLQGHASPVTSVAFIRDGSAIISGSYDNTFRLWVYNNNSNVWEQPIIYVNDFPIAQISYRLIKNPRIKHAYDERAQLAVKPQVVDLFAICSTQSIKFLKVDTKPDETLNVLVKGMGDIKDIKDKRKEDKRKEDKSKKGKSRRNSYRKKGKKSKKRNNKKNRVY